MKYDAFCSIHSVCDFAVFFGAVLLVIDSDNDTYSDSVDIDDEDDVDDDGGSGHISSSNGQSGVPRSGTFLRTKRSNTVSNLLAMTRSVAPSKVSSHRHSNSLSGDGSSSKAMSRADLLNLYRTTPTKEMSMAYFSNLAKATKSSQSTQSVAEQRARDEVEKKYKPQLQKS